jgi:predicted esterase
VITSPAGAALTTVSSPARSGVQQAVAAVLVLHGGSEDSELPTQWRNLAIVRLWPVAKVIARSVPGAVVYRLRFTVRGWNGDGASAVADARWALAELRSRHPGLPVVVVGHSLGARVAVHVGGDEDVAGLVLLAPWAPSGDPAQQLAGVPVVLVQGGRDRMIPLATTEPWVARAENAPAIISRTVLPWGEHTMLLRFWVWHQLAAAGVRTVLSQARVAEPGQRAD